MTAKPSWFGAASCRCWRMRAASLSLANPVMKASPPASLWISQLRYRRWPKSGAFGKPGEYVDQYTPFGRR